MGLIDCESDGDRPDRTCEVDKGDAHRPAGLFAEPQGIVAQPSLNDVQRIDELRESARHSGATSFRLDQLRDAAGNAYMVSPPLTIAFRGHGGLCAGDCSIISRSLKTSSNGTA